MGKGRINFVAGHNFYDNSSRTWWPEKNLYASVIARAIFDLVVPDPKLRQSADAWLTGRIPGTLTFKTCLEVLELDPVYITQLVKSYTSNQAKNFTRMRAFRSFNS